MTRRILLFRSHLGEAKGLPWAAPAICLLAGLSVYPMVFSVKVSLTGLAGGFSFEHYLRLISDRFFLVSLWQTAVYSISALTAEFLLGLALALLVDSLAGGRGIVRAGLLIPMLLPPVVAAVVWRLIYNPQFGVLNGTLRVFGIDTSHLTWTSGEGAAMFSVVLVDIWEWTPFLFLLLTAGLQAIPQEPVEAARMDGASNWQILRDVTLPLLKPTIALALLLRGMDLMRIFDQIFILTQGGPGFATQTTSLYIYQTAFRFSNFGYAAAMSFVSLAITTICARVLLRFLRFS